MKQARVLVLEDEPKLARLLEGYLVQEGYAPVVVRDGSKAIEAIRREKPDVVVLDLMMPGRDGLSICRELRSFSTVPVIMTTARVDEADRLLGLDVGADDYVCKPYSPREVVARVRAQLRRVGWLGDAAASVANALAMDDKTLRASVDGVAIDLTPVEFRLLRLLAGQPSRVYTRDQVLAQIHADGREVTDRVVDSHVRNLRRKIAAVSGGIDPIRSIYGVGYAFEWPEASS